MGFFRQPTPRRFHHPYIYVDERKERLKQLVEQARKEQAVNPSEEACKETLREAFRQATPHPTRHQKSPVRGFSFVQVAAVLLLMAVFYYLVFVRA
ncbi:MAG: hypothetical protein HXO24_06805 [Prevotella sp.]|nr:hypothetical protein [Prevotella sp.]